MCIRDRSGTAREPCGAPLPAPLRRQVYRGLHRKAQRGIYTTYKDRFNHASAVLLQKKCPLQLQVLSLLIPTSSLFAEKWVQLLKYISGVFPAIALSSNCCTPQCSCKKLPLLKSDVNSTPWMASVINVDFFGQSEFSFNSIGPKCIPGTSNCFVRFRHSMWWKRDMDYAPVSYTHLTLPTILLV